MFVGNNEYVMESFSAGTRASLKGGSLSLYVTNAVGPIGMMRLALRAVAYRLRASRDLDALTASTVVVHTRRRHIPVATDGEVRMMDTPLHYHIRPGVLRVLVPRPSEGQPAA